MVDVTYLKVFLKNYGSDHEDVADNRAQNQTAENHTRDVDVPPSEARNETGVVASDGGLIV